MKYRVLLMGNNKSTIDDIFLYLDDTFECQNTSNRFDDIVCHMKYFQPHVFVYCMSSETNETMSQLITIKREKTQRRTLFVIVGTPEDCQEFHKLSADTADLELLKPITVLQIAESITNFLKRGPAVSENDYEPVIHAKDEPPLPSEKAPVKRAVPSIEEIMNTKKESGRRHILVVDDDARMLRLIKRYLDDTFDIGTAVNGRVAMKFLESNTTDLILLDYEMPNENGPAVLEKLRADPILKDIPVIFLTGINDRKKTQQVLALQPQGYLLKPIDYKKLVNTIKDVIG